MKVIAVDGIKKEIGHVNSFFCNGVFAKVFRNLGRDYVEYYRVLVKKGWVGRNGRWITSDRFLFSDIPNVREVLLNAVDFIKRSEDVFLDLDLSQDLEMVFTGKYLVESWFSCYQAISYRLDIV